MNELSYKGYRAKVEFSAGDGLLVGEVLDIDALIVFAAEDARAIQAQFEQAITHYLADCAEEGVEPDKPYKGSFNVRIGPVAHRRAAELARQWRTTLNDVVRIAVEQIVDRHDARRETGFILEPIRAERQAQYEPLKPVPMTLSPVEPYARTH